MLSSDLLPYREALAGFEEALAEPVLVSILGDGEVRIPGESRVVVTFGSKAFLRDYRDRLALVSCMAPAAQAGDEPIYDDRRRIRVRMLPAAM